MSQPAGRRATYQDLVGLAEDVRAEILDGRLEQSPAPLPRHSKAQRSLGRFVGGPFDDDDGHGGPGGWWIFIEIDVELSVHDVVRPDLAGWRRQRLANPAEQRPIRVTPDWICEIVSPTSQARDRVIKRNLYARHGVPYYWLVDPESRTLEALELKDGRWWELGAWDETTKAAIPPFEAVILEIGRLFLPKEDRQGPGPAG